MRTEHLTAIEYQRKAADVLQHPGKKILQELIRQCAIRNKVQTYFVSTLLILDSETVINERDKTRQELGSALHESTKGCNPRFITGVPSDKQQKSLKTRRVRGHAPLKLFEKLQLKWCNLAPTWTYFGLDRNFNCFFKVQTAYQLHDSGVLAAKSVFP